MPGSFKTNTFDLEDENARIIVQNEPQYTHAEEDTLIEKLEIKSKQDQSVCQSKAFIIP